MRFLIDANLPRAAIDLCQKFGHQVEFARDIGMAAAPDEQLAARARESGAALLTRDLDFGDVRRYPPDQYQGILVLRLPDTTVAQAERQLSGDSAAPLLGFGRGLNFGESQWTQIHHLVTIAEIDLAPTAKPA